MSAFITELLVELIVGGIVMLILLVRQKRFLKKIRRTKQQLELTKLNVSHDDKVLLIDSTMDIAANTTSYQEADIVLMKDKDGMYNIVMKNKYGREGLIT